MKIIKHGVYGEEFWQTKLTCKKCGCVFYVANYDVDIRDITKRKVCYSVDCPECRLTKFFYRKRKRPN